MDLNRSFAAGNKRSAYVVCQTFLILNGWDMIGDMAERYSVIMVLAAGEIDEDPLVAWLRTNSRPDQVNEPHGVSAETKSRESVLGGRI